MATYPTTRIAVDSDPDTRDGRDEAFAYNGDAYVRSFYSADRTDFNLRHPALSPAELAVVKAFYDAYRTDTFDFYWPLDGVTYTGVRFGKGGFRRKWVGPGLCDVMVRLVG